MLAELKEGSCERVCKKVGTSVRARRFVQACVQEGSYKFSSEKVKVDKRGGRRSAPALFK